LQTRTAADLTRVTQPSGEVTQGAISAIFSTPDGKAGSAPGSAPLTEMVFVVDDITVPEYAPDGEALTQAKEQFDTQFVGDLLGMYVGELQNKTSVRFNQALLEQIMGVAPN
jgi:hypothetical protein